ncbi:DUF6951 family protein [Thermodesulfobacteriota bacterium]
MKVTAGACGFTTRIKAVREEKLCARIEIETDCESVEELKTILEAGGPIEMKEFIGTAKKGNKILQLAFETLPHSACPVAVGIIKTLEVELGLNVPKPVLIEFEPDSED